MRRSAQATPPREQRKRACAAVPRKRFGGIVGGCLQRGWAWRVSESAQECPGGGALHACADACAGSSSERGKYARHAARLRNARRDRSADLGSSRFSSGRQARKKQPRTAPTVSAPTVAEMRLRRPVDCGLPRAGMPRLGRRGLTSQALARPVIKRHEPLPILVGPNPEIEALAK